MKNRRVKLTLTIDKSILAEAKKVSEEKNIPLSRVVENFLKFFADPEVYCFKCGTKFKVKEAKVCPKCGWLICPKCGACRCSLSDEVAESIYYMRKVYEDLLIGRINP